MFDINLCEEKAAILAKKAIDQIDEKILEDFYKEFVPIVDIYKRKYLFSSSSVTLQTSPSFREWLPNFLKNKQTLMPIVIDKMVNEKDLYYLSLYNAAYSGSDLIPDISQFNDEYFKNGGGDHSLALLTGCFWLDHQTPVSML